jgi:hypothetical protein
MWNYIWRSYNVNSSNPSRFSFLPLKKNMKIDYSVEQQRNELLEMLYDKALWSFLSSKEKEKVQKIKSYTIKKPVK